MNKLTNLTATAIDGTWVDHYPVVGAVPVQPTPGQSGVLQLNSVGLILRAGQNAVGVDLSELMALLAPQLRATTETPALGIGLGTPVAGSGVKKTALAKPSNT